MKITRITLVKESYRKEAEDVNRFIADMEADAKKAGYEVTGVEARLDMNISRCSVEVTAERRGKLERVTSKELWASGDRVKPVDLKISTEDKCK